MEYRVDEYIYNGRESVFRSLRGSDKGASELFSWGNSKLATSIAIYNPGGACKSCPSRAAGRCQVADVTCRACGIDWVCFGDTTETFRKTAGPKRRRQAAMFRQATGEEMAIAILFNRRKAVTAVRFSEGGDIAQQWQVVKLAECANILAGHGVGAGVYSAASHLDWTVRGALVLNASGWGTPGTDCDNRVDIQCVCGVDGDSNCGGNCGKGCTWCYEKGTPRNIRIKYHAAVFNGRNGPKYLVRLKRQAAEYLAALE